MRTTTVPPGTYSARPDRAPRSRLRRCDARLGVAAMALLLTAAAPSCRRQPEAEPGLDAKGRGADVVLAVEAGPSAAAASDACDTSPGTEATSAEDATADSPTTVPEPWDGDLGEAVDGCPAGLAPIEGLAVCIERWEAAIEGGRAVARPGRPPAAQTSWREADAACRAAGRRLCTLAEWEQACAGTAGRQFPYGDEFVPGRCNGERPGGAAHPSGGDPECVTPEGVFDLSGNVWEWTADALQGGEVHELRGGGWANGEALLRCHSDERLLQPADEPHSSYGFRCCVER
jgi:hypothetical protein